MKPVDSAELLCRTTLERIARGRISKELSLEVLERSNNAVERSQRLLGPQPVVDGNTTLLQEIAVPLGCSPSAPVDLMETIFGRALEGEHVVLDGKHFIDCVLNHCLLEYSGHPVILETTQFHQCSFRFLGSAALTMRFAECFGLVTDSAPAFQNALAGSTVVGRPN